MEIESEEEGMEEEEDFQILEVSDEVQEPAVGVDDSFRSERTDDFVRNFLQRLGMNSTLEVF
jgi:hypothetical protein